MARCQHIPFGEKGAAGKVTCRKMQRKLAFAQECLGADANKIRTRESASYLYDSAYSNGTLSHEKLYKVKECA